MSDKRLELLSFCSKLCPVPPDLEGKCGNDGMRGQGYPACPKKS